MNDILSQIPGIDNVKELISKNLNINNLDIDGLKSLKIDEITAHLADLKPEFPNSLNIPEIPNLLTPEGFLKNITSSVGQIKNIEPLDIFNKLSANCILTNLENPDFNINSIISQINSQIININSSIPSFNLNSSAINLSEILIPIQTIIQTSSTTPLKVFKMILNIVDGLANSLSDSDKLVNIAKESLEEIYSAQVDGLKYKIPLYAFEELTKSLNGEDNLLEKYDNLLKQFNTVDTNSEDEIKVLYNNTLEILPELNKISTITDSIISLKDDSLDSISKTIDHITDFADSEKVFLGDAYNIIGDKITEVIGNITDPVNQLSNISNNIVTYLNNVAEKSGEVADTMYMGLNYMVKDFMDPIYAASYYLNVIEGKISDFFNSIKIEDYVKNYKKVYHDISIKIEDFIIKIETLKIKLDSEVISLKVKVDENVSPAFKKIQDKIREILSNLSSVLEKDEVKDALNKAKEIVEKCKNVIEDCSFEPVFDFVVEKTDEAGNKIENFNTSKLGVPEKTVLKMGTKIIKQAEVDKIVRDQLLEIYNELNEPLKELVSIIEKKVLVIEEKIYNFNPGTIANDFIMNSDAYKMIITLLESFKPSKLLEPIKTAYDEIKVLITQTDPDIIVESIQIVYDSIEKIIPVLNPDSLYPVVKDGADIVLYKLKQINDTNIKDIVDNIKNNLSLEKLMESTGINEIANADFWNILRNIFSGEVLNKVTDALDSIETKISENSSLFDFSKPVTQLALVVSEIERQLNINVEILKNRISEAKNIIDEKLSFIDHLKESREALLLKYSNNKEISWLLNQIDLTGFYLLKTNIDLLFNLEDSVLDSLQVNINQVLSDSLSGLKSIKLLNFQNALLGIFKKQLSTPTKELILLIQGKLQPFEDAVTSIQNILNTLAIVPAKIDTSIKKVIDGIQETITSIISFLIGVYDSFILDAFDILKITYDNVVRLFSELNPYWLFNSFSIYDFYGIEYKIDTVDGNAIENIKTFDFGNVYFRFGSPYLRGKEDKSWKPYPPNCSEEFLDSELQKGYFDLLDNIKSQILDNGNYKIKKIILSAFCDPVGDSDWHKKTLAVGRANSVKSHITDFNYTVNTKDNNNDDILKTVSDDITPHIVDDTRIVDIFEFRHFGEDSWLDDTIESYEKKDVPPGQYKKSDKLKRYVNIKIEVVESTFEKKYVITDAKGILAVAKSICQPGSDSIAISLGNKLTEDEISNLRREVIDDINPDSVMLSEGNCNNVIKALNLTLQENSVSTETIYNIVKSSLTSFIGQLSTYLSQPIEDVDLLTDEEIKERVNKTIWKYRANALVRALSNSKSKYSGAGKKYNFLIRYNRVLLEAHYIEHIRLSLQSFFLFILEVLSNLYPEVVVENLDAIYDEILKNIKKFPDEMIKQPLDEEFNKIKNILKDNFNIDDVFKIINLKLDGLNKEVESGLNRISISYNEMLNTIDNNLSK